MRFRWFCVGLLGIIATSSCNILDTRSRMDILAPSGDWTLDAGSPKGTEEVGELHASIPPSGIPPERESEVKEPSYEPLQADWIVVVKSQRVMRLLRRGEVIREYTVSLGKNPRGHKVKQGDNRTPEGLYVIAGRNPKSAYHLALKISYPDPIDVLNAKAKGVNPGGNIMIHGLPNGIKNKYLMEKDWTNGCIAVSNEEMEEIWNLVPDGTPIEILP